MAVHGALRGSGGDRRPSPLPPIKEWWGVRWLSLGRGVLTLLLAVLSIGSCSGSICPDISISPHTSQVNQLLSLSQGTLTAIASADMTISVWDFRSATPLMLHKWLAHDNVVYGITEIREGIFVSSGGDYRVRLWDYHTGTMIKELSTDMTIAVFAVIPGIDGVGTRLVGAEGQTSLNIYVWDTITWELTVVQRASEEHYLFNSGVVDLGNERLGVIKVAGTDTVLSVLDVYNTTSWTITATIELNHLGSPDLAVLYKTIGGQLVTAGLSDGLLKVWDLNTLSLIQTVDTATTGAISCVDSNRDGILAVGTSDKTIILYDPVRWIPVKVLEGEEKIGVSLLSGPMGLISGTGSGKILVWPTLSDNVARSFKTNNRGKGGVQLVSPTMLWVGDSSGEMFEIDIESAESTPVLSKTGGRPHTGSIRYIASRMSAVGRNTTVTASDNYSIKIWDTTKRQELYEYTNTHGSTYIRALLLSLEGDIITGGLDGIIEVRSSVEPYEFKGKMSGHTDSIRALVFSKDEKELLSGGYDGNIIIWTVASRKVKKTIRRPKAAKDAVISMVRLHGKENTYAVGLASGNVEVWNVVREEYHTILTTQTDWIMKMTVLSDGFRFVTASADKSLKLWDMRTWDNGPEAVLIGHTGMVLDVTVTNEDAIISSSTDFLVKQWLLKCDDDRAFCLQGSSRPILCPSDYYCDRGSIRICPPGSFCPAESKGPSPCAPGTYSSLLGMKTPCTAPCMPGTYCAGGSVAPVMCPLGFYCPSGKESIACLPKTYCKSGSPKPISCSVGFYCPDPATQLPCKPGKYCDEEGLLDGKPCEVGTYLNTVGGSRKNDCIKCPEATTTKHSEATRSEECVCAASYYDDNVYINSTSHESPPVCEECTDGMNCTDIDTQKVHLRPKHGYYLINTTEGWPDTLPCDSTLQCLTTGCNAELGYQGFLCNKCVVGFYKVGIAECESCTSRGTWIYFQTILALFAGLAFLVFIIWKKMTRNRKSKGKTWFNRLVRCLGYHESLQAPNKQNNLPVVQKIFLNHLQLVGLIGRLKLRWGESLKNAFFLSDSIASFNFLSNGATLTSGFQCWIYSASAPTVVNDLVLGVLIVLWYMLCIAIFWPLYSYCYKEVSNLNQQWQTQKALRAERKSKMTANKAEGDLEARNSIAPTSELTAKRISSPTEAPPPKPSVAAAVSRTRGTTEEDILPNIANIDEMQLSTYRKIIISIVAILLFMYSNLVRAFLELFHCTKFEKTTSRVWGTLDMECYSWDHVVWILTLGVPYALIIVIGLPVIALIKLRDLARTQSIVKDQFHNITYGYLYDGIKGKFWYWELVCVLRKVAFSAISVFMVSDYFSDETNYQQGMAGMVIIVVATALHIYFWPYQENDLNHFEFAGLVANFFTLYVGCWDYEYTSTLGVILIVILQTTWLAVFILTLFTEIKKKLSVRIAETTRNIFAGKVTPSWAPSPTTKEAVTPRNKHKESPSATPRGIMKEPKNHFF